jgi:hypothetical protein
MQKILGMVARTCHYSKGKKLKSRMIIVQAGLGNKKDPISKITRAK